VTSSPFWRSRSSWACSTRNRAASKRCAAKACASGLGPLRADRTLPVWATPRRYCKPAAAPRRLRPHARGCRRLPGAGSSGRFYQPPAQPVGPNKKRICFGIFLEHFQGILRPLAAATQFLVFAYLAERCGRPAPGSRPWLEEPSPGGPGFAVGCHLITYLS
jgi:hypothetical protein